jgi:hypothetical protein
VADWSVDDGFEDERVMILLGGTKDNFLLSTLLMLHKSRRKNWSSSIGLTSS